MQTQRVTVVLNTVYLPTQIYSVNYYGNECIINQEEMFVVQKQYLLGRKQGSNEKLCNNDQQQERK